MSRPPAGGTGAPSLPVTWRPRRTRAVAYTVAAAVVAAMVGLAAGLPGSSATVADRIAFVALGLAVAAFLHVLARPRLTAEVAGLTVVNLFRGRHLTWAQVVHVNLRRGDPWVYLDLDDGETLPVMGIQASDGAGARAAAEALRALLEEHSRTERDD